MKLKMRSVMQKIKKIHSFQKRCFEMTSGII